MNLKRKLKKEDQYYKFITSSEWAIKGKVLHMIAEAITYVSARDKIYYFNYSIQYKDDIRASSYRLSFFSARLFKRRVTRYLTKLYDDVREITIPMEYATITIKGKSMRVSF